MKYILILAMVQSNLHTVITSIYFDSFETCHTARQIIKDKESEKWGTDYRWSECVKK